MIRLFEATDEVTGEFQLFNVNEIKNIRGEGETVVVILNSGQKVKIGSFKKPEDDTRRYPINAHLKHNLDGFIEHFKSKIIEI